MPKHLLFCLILVGGFGLAYAFIPQVRNLGWLGLAVLACPLMHLFMPHHSEPSRDHKTVHKPK